MPRIVKVKTAVGDDAANRYLEMGWEFLGIAGIAPPPPINPSQPLADAYVRLPTLWAVGLPEGVEDRTVPGHPVATTAKPAIPPMTVGQPVSSARRETPATTGTGTGLPENVVDRTAKATAGRVLT